MATQIRRWVRYIFGLLIFLCLATACIRPTDVLHPTVTVMPSQIPADNDSSFIPLQGTELIEDWPTMTPVGTHVENEPVPIAIARNKLGAELTIEGVVTMYTGGYYAGDGNVKFYLVDESGGLQVQVFGGEGVVDVKIGERVAVQGIIGVYRNALQIVPQDAVKDVVVISPENDSMPELFPLSVSIEDAVSDLEDLPGRLLQVNGLVTRVEEFNYSYEIDLNDEQGNTLTVYVDKRTGINVAGIIVGQYCQLIGILEQYDSKNLLYPRLQVDLQDAFSSTLHLVADGPLTRVSGRITYTFTVYNHTPEILASVVVTAVQPAFTSISKVENGQRIDNYAFWILPELEPNTQAVMTMTVNIVPSYDGLVRLSGPIVTANEWPTPVTADDVYTFFGTTVPVWAIQGDSFRSPLVLEYLTTWGVVTGIFPGLMGFFIQDIDPDGNPLTSDGLFVDSSALTLNLVAGDIVIVTGTVRESSGQTTLQITTVDDVEVISHGNPLPRAVELDPPANVVDALAYYEKLEGMFTQVTGPALVVTPTSKYGEYVIVRLEHDVKRLFQGEDDINGIGIMVDDGSSITYTDYSQMLYTVTTGDTISALIGPLAYTYEHYKLEPVVTPSIQSLSSDFHSPTFHSPTSNQFFIMTWNIEYLFGIHSSCQWWGRFY